LGLQLATAAALENIANAPATLGGLIAKSKGVPGTDVLSENLQSEEFQSLAGALRPIQTGNQNIAAGLIGLAPFTVPVAGQGLFALDLTDQLSKDPAAAIDIAKEIGKSFAAPFSEEGRKRLVAGLWFR
jgi:hypothetical protein